MMDLAGNGFQLHRTFLDTRGCDESAGKGREISGREFIGFELELRSLRFWNWILAGERSETLDLTPHGGRGEIDYAFRALLQVL